MFKLQELVQVIDPLILFFVQKIKIEEVMVENSFLTGVVRKNLEQLLGLFSATLFSQTLFSHD